MRQSGDKPASILGHLKKYNSMYIIYSQYKKKMQYCVYTEHFFFWNKAKNNGSNIFDFNSFNIAQNVT